MTHKNSTDQKEVTASDFEVAVLPVFKQRCCSVETKVEVEVEVEGEKQDKGMLTTIGGSSCGEGNDLGSTRVGQWDEQCDLFGKRVWTRREGSWHGSVALPKPPI